MKIIFQGDAAPGVTVVSNEFIDRYMPSIGGAYVEAYLYLLRHQDEEVTDTRIADSLRPTEGDVKHALLRWQREGLIAGDIGQSGLRKAESGYELPETPPEPEPLPENPGPESTEPVLPSAKLPDKSGVDFRCLQDDSEFVGLNYALQRYLGRTFSQTDTETVAYLYGALGMSASLLVKLSECYAEKKRSSLRYFKKVALDQCERGIRTPEKAEQRSQSYTKEVYAALKAFDIRDRGPGVKEQKFIGKWYHEYTFSEELVTETYSRTPRYVNKPDFPYADDILTKQCHASIHDIQNITEKDKKREETGREKDTESGAKKNGTRFHNFEEREGDSNDLVLQQLKRKLEQES